MGFKEGGFDDIITTRRLEEVCKAFAIFDDERRRSSLTLTRFDPRYAGGVLSTSTPRSTPPSSPCRRA
jgi:hypothetical protein